MQSCIKTALRCNFHIITKADLSGVNKYTIVIGEKIVTNFDVPTESAEKIGLYIGIGSALAEKLADQLLPALLVGRQRPVILPTQISSQQMHGFTAGKQGAI